MDLAARRRRERLGADHARLQLQLHLLRGAAHPRPGEEPLARPHRAGGARWSPRASVQVTLLGQTVDAYGKTMGDGTTPRLLLRRLGTRIDGLHAPALHHQPPDGHHRRVARDRRRARPRSPSTCTSSPRADPGPDPAADGAALRPRGLPGAFVARPRAHPGRRAAERLHRRLPARERPGTSPTPCR